ncbi:uncharacterized protein LOC109947119 [Prunus persica]|uniref:uncharacterized protein LOC109947119 n=1 Tax=Prunus persica TaxID=3760 RepID=UPI0009AB2A20|nr:uncharacterized protein LOC109947119 [Prunus persica]
MAQREGQIQLAIMVMIPPADAANVGSNNGNSTRPTPFNIPWPFLRIPSFRRRKPRPTEFNIPWDFLQFPSSYCQTPANVGSNNGNPTGSTPTNVGSDNGNPTGSTPSTIKLDLYPFASYERRTPSKPLLEKFIYLFFQKYLGNGIMYSLLKKGS